MTETRWRIAKVDYNRTGRKTNMAELSWRLDGKQLTVQGGIYNAKQTDYLCCGQMVDEIARLFPEDDLVQEIFQTWQQWHLKVVTDDSVLEKIKSWTGRTL